MARSVGPSSSILLSNEGSMTSLSNDIFLGIFISKSEKKAFFLEKNSPEPINKLKSFFSVEMK